MNSDCRSQVLGFLKSSGNAAYLNEIELSQLFESYLKWCSEKYLEPAHGSSGTFARSLFAVRSDFKKRRARKYRSGHKVVVFLQAENAKLKPKHDLEMEAWL